MAAVSTVTIRCRLTHDGPTAGRRSHLPVPLFRRWSARHHAGVKAGANHQQERLAVGRCAGDPGDGLSSSRRARGGRQSRFPMGEHIAGAN
jgi:hypothetical protein